MSSSRSTSVQNVSSPSSPGCSGWLRVIALASSAYSVLSSGVTVPTSYSHTVVAAAGGTSN